MTCSSSCHHPRPAHLAHMPAYCLGMQVRAWVCQRPWTKGMECSRHMRLAQFCIVVSEGAACTPLLRLLCLAS